MALGPSHNQPRISGELVKNASFVVKIISVTFLGGLAVLHPLDGQVHVSRKY